MDEYSIHHLSASFENLLKKIRDVKTIVIFEMRHFMIRSILHTTHLQLFECTFAHVLQFVVEKDGNKGCNFITLSNLSSYMTIPVPSGLLIPWPTFGLKINFGHVACVRFSRTVERNSWDSCFGEITVFGWVFISSISSMEGILFCLCVS